MKIDVSQRLLEDVDMDVDVVIEDESGVQVMDVLRRGAKVKQTGR